MAFVTRFAPSPTGPLHLGHAYSAIVAHDMARAEGGTFLLRIEDIDQTRCRPDWESQLLDDLHWLGVTWDAPPMKQSQRLCVYQQALDMLWSRGLIYPCTCTRRDIDAALGAPQEGVPRMIGPDGAVYPGTCRRADRGGARPSDRHLRLDMTAALAIAGATVFTETGPAQSGAIETHFAHYSQVIGDIILARRDFGTSYHLSVVLDDAAMGITQVVRGDDLFDAARIHALLQRLLDLPTPIYHHHRLIRDTAGKRLAKRDDARALSKYRAEGASPTEIRRMVGL
jgi:glutamyl-Q tRNA(Asp) synthetase